VRQCLVSQVACWGRMLSLIPDSIMVTAVVVRRDAAPLGVLSKCPRTSREVIGSIETNQPRHRGQMRRETSDHLARRALKTRREWRCFKALDGIAQNADCGFALGGIEA